MTEDTRGINETRNTMTTIGPIETSDSKVEVVNKPSLLMKFNENFDLLAKLSALFVTIAWIISTVSQAMLYGKYNIDPRYFYVDFIEGIPAFVFFAFVNLLVVLPFLKSKLYSVDSDKSVRVSYNIILVVTTMFLIYVALVSMTNMYTGMNFKIGPLFYVVISLMSIIIVPLYTVIALNFSEIMEYLNKSKKAIIFFGVLLSVIMLVYLLIFEVSLSYSTLMRQYSSNSMSIITNGRTQQVYIASYKDKFIVQDCQIVNEILTIYTDSFMLISPEDIRISNITFKDIQVDSFESK